MSSLSKQFLIGFLCLVCCACQQRLETNIQPTTISQPVSSITVNVTVTPISTFVSSTPTMRVLEEKVNCKSEDDNSGYILFVASYNDVYDGDILYVMNDDGCYIRKIMENVSGSAAWSKDSALIAIGCEDNTSICILDAQATLDTCTGEAQGLDGACDPAILEKIVLPLDIAELGATSWSPNGDKLAVSSVDTEDESYSIRILNLDDRNWKTLLSQTIFPMSVTWSPIYNHLLAIQEKDGIFLYDLTKQSNVEFVTYGYGPEWSSDGQQIAFVKPADIDAPMVKEGHGIAVINLMSREWHWVYEPKAWDNYYPNLPDDRQNVEMINVPFGRCITWPPNATHVFLGAIYHADNSQVLRLDLETEELRPLLVYPDLEGLLNANYIIHYPVWGSKSR